MKNWLAFGLIVCTAGLTACKKTGPTAPPEPPTTPFEAAVYTKGTVQGNAVQKRIDAAGGTIASSDGYITITIPAGALNNAVDFVLQEVQATAPNSSRSFRLQPEVATAKPFTIRFLYGDADVDGTDPMGFDIIRHNTAGNWMALNNTTVDTSTRVLQASTQRIGDFSFTGYYYAVAQSKNLEPGQSTTVTISKTPVDNSTRNKEESALGTEQPLQTDADVENWEKEGEGTMNAAQKLAVQFTAGPNSGEATLSANIRNVLRSRRGLEKKLRLRRKIMSQSGSFFAGHFDGLGFNCPVSTVIVAGSTVMIQGAISPTQKVLIILNQADIGTFPIGNMSLGAKACDIRTDLAGPVFEGPYNSPACGPNQQHLYGSGKVILGELNAQRAAGQFTGTLYNDQNCTISSKQISGSFRIRR